MTAQERARMTGKSIFDEWWWSGLDTAIQAEIQKRLSEKIIEFIEAAERDAWNDALEQAAQANEQRKVLPDALYVENTQDLIEELTRFIRALKK